MLLLAIKFGTRKSRHSRDPVSQIIVKKWLSILSFSELTEELFERVARYGKQTSYYPYMLVSYESKLGLSVRPRGRRKRKIVRSNPWATQNFPMSKNFKVQKNTAEAGGRDQPRISPNIWRGLLWTHSHNRRSCRSVSLLNRIVNENGDFGFLKKG